MKKARASKKRQTPKVSKKDCPFCKSKNIPDYKNFEKLEKFISDRGKIIPSIYTGVCSRHQKFLGMAIKRARFLGLLPYTSSIR